MRSTYNAWTGFVHVGNHANGTGAPEVTLKHEKIRFRRGDIVGLHTYPSARELEGRHVRLWQLHRIGRLVGLVAIGATGLVLLLVAAAFAIGSFGFSGDRLKVEAQAAISRLAGEPMETSFGPARVSFDKARLIALELRDMKIGRVGQGAPLVRAGQVRFGLHVLPLLSGQISLGSATLSEARIDLSSWDSGTRVQGGRPLFEAIGGEDGLVNAREVISAAFAQVHEALDAIGPSRASAFDFKNVEVTLPRGLPVRTMRILDAHVTKSRGGKLLVSGQVVTDDHQIHIEGTFERPAPQHEAGKFALELRSMSAGQAPSQVTQENRQAEYVWLGPLTLSLTGDQAAHGGEGEISADLTFDKTQLKFRHSHAVEGSGHVAATLIGGTNKVEFSTIDIVAGHSRLLFSGALGPMPKNEAGTQPPFYRYEFVSNQSLIASDDTNEPALPIAAKMSGRISNDWRRIFADHLDVITDQGEVVASGSLLFSGDETPALGLAVGLSRLPLGYVKTLWPWFASPRAREWVLANVYGGTVENGRLVLNARPGSLAEGVTLGPDEISGHFEVRGSRFDVTGTIPPVRDAVGDIDFQGTDVEISLRSGTVFMPSGRTLAARDGTFLIADAHLHPLIGDLNIDIEGSADAVAEIGSYEPINMARYIDLPPAALSGDVKGHIQARIPLEDGVKASELDWQVDLAYSDLTIAQPFDGQMVSGATGTIMARPELAQIDATAELNDIPAEISLTEPLDGSDTRSLRAKLHLDDSSRDKLFPGLSDLLSGPFTVELDGMSKDQQRVTVDIGQAVLSLPWIGWSKGAGVPAKASFVLSTDGKVNQITDFELVGDGFGASGALRIDGDGLASAEFSRIALNRGDNAAATIRRQRGRYAIAVSGKSLDVRSVIRRFSRFTDGTAGGNAADEGEDFSIDANLAEVVGFHDERLRDLKLVYSGAGTTVGGMRASATTPEGARTTIVDATAGGSRKIEVQTADAGTVLRFLDVYENVRGGSAVLSLSGPAGGPLNGQIDARDFAIVNESKLDSIVNKPPPGSDRSLNQAVRRDVDVSQARFERGFARIEKGENYLRVADGVVRGPSIGSTFQGTVFDENDNISITGTFMPAYGLNRLFGEIPLLGQILGNGRDRGLIGITFKLTGKTSEPQLSVNPLSIVAPGIFRSIFEFR